MKRKTIVKSFLLAAIFAVLSVGRLSAQSMPAPQQLPALMPEYRFLLNVVNYPVNEEDDEEYPMRSPAYYNTAIVAEHDVETASMALSFNETIASFTLAFYKDGQLVSSSSGSAVSGGEMTVALSGFAAGEYVAVVNTGATNALWCAFVIE